MATLKQMAELRQRIAALKAAAAGKGINLKDVAAIRTLGQQMGLTPAQMTQVRDAITGGGARPKPTQAKAKATTQKRTATTPTAAMVQQVLSQRLPGRYVEPAGRTAKLSPLKIKPVPRKPVPTTPTTRTAKLPPKVATRIRKVKPGRPGTW